MRSECIINKTNKRSETPYPIFIGIVVWIV
jgi:hypothetical protein